MAVGATDVKAEFIWMNPVVGEGGVFGGNDGLGGYTPAAVATAGGTITWVHGNHLGVPIVYTDATGAPVAPPTGYSIPGFPGQSQTLADLYYNRYRDYDPTTGRYIQADPIGLAGGSNPYSYAMNNPVRYMDPSGQCPWCLAALGGALLGAGTELAFQAFDNWLAGRKVFDRKCYEWGEVLFAGGVGAFGGAWLKTMVRMPPGSMAWNNVSRRIRRAEKMIGEPEDLHHWFVPRSWGLPERWVNRPWNLNPVPRGFHRELHGMNPFLGTVLGAPRPVQGAGLWGVGGLAGELSDGTWE